MDYCADAWLLNELLLLVVLEQPPVMQRISQAWLIALSVWFPRARPVCESRHVPFLSETDIVLGKCHASKQRRTKTNPSSCAFQ